MKDDLGNRIKSQYENITKYFLPRRTYSIVRMDGKAFHSYTKNCKKPYDKELMESMNITAQFLCSQIQAAKFAYVQSDEISILLTDFEKETTSMWFDGNIQKISSVSSSICTAKFNQLRIKNFPDKLAMFDSRIFTIPDRIEVMNYFIWRNLDAERNSISMLGRTYFSHKQLNNKNTSEIQEMLFQQYNINWSEEPEGFKNGRLIIKEYKDINGTLRSEWDIKDAWKFTKDKDKLLNLIPDYPNK